MRNLYGQMLRRARLEQNLSQEDLCRGICVPSYLSKIEQGQADAGQDVLRALFSALHLRLETDEAFLIEAERIVTEFFQKICFGQNPDAEADFLSRHKDRLRCSRLHMEAAIAQLFMDPAAGKALLPALAPCLADLTPMQRKWFYLGKAHCETDRNTRLADLTLADQTQPDAFTALEKAQCFYELGRYAEAVETADAATRRGAQEGNVYAMLYGSFFCGTSYANRGDIDMMLLHYRRVLALARGSSFDIAGEVQYNIGATLCECRRYEEALPYLLGAAADGQDNSLTRHKLCLTYAALRQPVEAAAQLAQAYEKLSPDAPPLLKSILDLAGMQLQEGYLDCPDYEKLLEKVYLEAMEIYHFGFRRFFSFYLIDLRVHQRRYKDALLLTQQNL